MSKTPIVRLVREPSTDSGTFGKITIDGMDFTCHSLELPWKDNKRSISCVPVGTYNVTHDPSPRFKKNLYRLHNVPGRAGILFHAGNYGGDKAKGMKSEIEGCILLGEGRAVWGKQEVVTTSGKTIKAFEDILGRKPFTLIISDAE